MNQKSEIGKLGEDIACEYLVNKGFKICERNFRKPWGELDIIAKDSGGVLVFVEVKAMRSRQNVEDPRCSRTASGQYGNDNSAIAEYEESFKNNPAIFRYARHKITYQDLSQLNPEENLTAAKLKKLRRTALLYAGYNQNLVNDEKGWRIDLVAISLKNVSRETFEKLLEGCQHNVSRETLSVWGTIKNLYKQVINLFLGGNNILTRLSDYCDIRHLENI